MSPFAAAAGARSGAALRHWLLLPLLLLLLLLLLSPSFIVQQAAAERLLDKLTEQLGRGGRSQSLPLSPTEKKQEKRQRRATSLPAGPEKTKQPRKEASILEDTGARVETFLMSGPGKKDLLRVFHEQQQQQLGPTNAIPVGSCGDTPMNRLYTAEEAAKELQQQNLPGLDSLETISREYQRFVVQHKDTLNTMRDKMQKRKHKKFSLAVVQWNALLVYPNTFELLSAFLSESSDINVDDVDGIVFLLQENMKLETKRERDMRENIRFVLNTLSTTPNWGLPSITYLSNIIGTQLKSPLTRNTQTILFVLRKPYTPLSTCSTEYAILKREKGFVGAVVQIPFFGSLALLGGHFKGWSSQQVEMLLPELVKDCGDPKEGLDSFSMGVLIAADWNEHLNTESLAHVYKLVTESNDSKYDVFKQQSSLLPDDATDNLRMQASLVSALSLPKETVEKDYAAILWGVDRLGRSVSIPSSSETLHEVLRQNSFSIVSACYPAGFSYKWKRGCPYPEETAKPGYTPFGVLKECLANKVYTSPRGAGYLDRVVLRLPSSSSKIIDAAVSSAAVGDSLPPLLATIRKGVQTYDFRSDHAMVTSLVEFIKLE